MEEGPAGLRGAGGPSRSEGGPLEGDAGLVAEEAPVARGSGAGVAPDSPAATADSWIPRTLAQVLKAPNLRLSLPEAPPVTVLLLERYVAVPVPSPPQAGVPCPARATPCPPYYYDVTVSDGIHQEKCHLAPQLNGLVHRNRLSCGLRVKIAQCSYAYNERRLSQGFLCLEQLEILGATALTGDPPELCPAKSTAPLKGSRRHYLPLWNNDDPCGDMWLEKKALQDVCVHESRLTTVSHLAMTWETKISFQPLLVRIIHKSRLRYYGKPETKLDVPYQAYFDVADHSGMVLMVLWGSLCPEWYHSMNIGTVLLLEKYAVKKSLSSKTYSSPGDLQMKRFCSIEIALNVRDPPAKINIIPEYKVKPEWKLPEVEYQFITRSELDKLAQNHFCDIIGLVQYVGRIERKRKKGSVEDFWTYRWVHAIDGTSEQPFIVELFVTSQPDIFEQIHPMTYLVCTQMRVERNISENGSSTVYLTTSLKSQMFITGWHKGQPYTKDPKVKNFIQWMKTQEEASYMDKTVIGGYYLFPPLPNTFLEYCKNMNEESTLIAISEMEKEIESLHYREQKRIAFQGIISAIRYVSRSSTSQDVSGARPVQIKKGSSVSTSVSESDHISKGRKKYQQAGTSTSEQKSPPLEQRKIVTRSCTKRQIATIEKTDPQPVPSQDTYLTRSAGKKRMLHTFLQDNSRAKKESKEVMETAQTYGSHKEITDGSKKVHTQRTSWEGAHWTAVKDNLTQYLNFSNVSPESFPSTFNYTHKEFLMKQCNLQAAQFKPKECLARREMSCFENACPLEYYEVAILGVNHDIAIEAALLHDSYLLQVKDKSQNKVFSYGSGTSACQETVAQEGLSALLSLSGVCLQWLSICNSQCEDVKAAVLENQRVICILDICSLDKDKTEVFLRKIYKITEADTVNQT